MTLLLFPELSVSSISYRVLQEQFVPASQCWLKKNCYTELTGQFCLLEICPCLNSASGLQEVELFQSVELSSPEYSV